MKKLSLLILLSATSLIQGFGRGVREVPTPAGHVGRTFEVDADSEMGAMMQRMNDREAQMQLESFHRIAQETSLPTVITQCDKMVQDLRHAMNQAAATNTEINAHWLNRILAMTERNCKALKAELKAQK